MENNEAKQIHTTGGEIDKEVFDILSQNDVLTAVSDDKQARRLILNCFMEFLSECKALNKQADEFMQVLSICSKDKLNEFFKQVKSGTQQQIRENAIKLKRKKHKR